MSTQTRTRNWTLTINNPTESQVPTKLLSKHMRCIAFAKEIAPGTGTPHLQGFVCYTTLKSFKMIKKDFPMAHIEPMKGSISQNMEYISKENEPVVIGDLPMSQSQKGEAGKKVYDEAWTAAKTGHLDDIPASLRIRYYSTFNRIKKDYMHKPDALECLTNEWIHGPTGTGKSRRTRERFPNAYYKMANKWWDGYQGEDVVVIEDFDAIHDKLGYHLKIWADYGGFLAETKGGVTYIRPKKFVITSNYTIREIWSAANTAEPLERRFKVVFYGEEIANRLKAKWAREALEKDAASALQALQEGSVEIPVPKPMEGSSFLDLIDKVDTPVPATIPRGMGMLSPIINLVEEDDKDLDGIKFNLWPTSLSFLDE